MQAQEGKVLFPGPGRLATKNFIDYTVQDKRPIRSLPVFSQNLDGFSLVRSRLLEGVGVYTRAACCRVVAWLG